jgi:ribosome-associated protein
MTPTTGSHKAAARTPAPRLPKAVRAAVDAALAKKALDIVVLDLRKTGAFTDYFVIAGGANPRQVQAIADAVRESLKALGVRPAHTEGYERAEWVLLDCFDFVIHVFSPTARSFYGLDRLWGNARRIEIEE